MSGLAYSDGKRISTRSRGRPSLATAAQIDREILEAARELFLSHGYERTSMAMVTYTAGVSKTTLYARYAAKADLFRATVLLTVDRIANQTLNEVERQAYELDQGLRAFGYQAMRISLAKYWSGYERLVYSEGARFPELKGAVAERTYVAIQTVSAFIQGCVDREGVVLKDLPGLATTYVMALRGFYTASILSDRTPDDEEIDTFVDKLVDLLMAARASW